MERIVVTGVSLKAADNVKEVARRILNCDYLEALIAVYPQNTTVTNAYIDILPARQDSGRSQSTLTGSQKSQSLDDNLDTSWLNIIGPSQFADTTAGSMVGRINSPSGSPISAAPAGLVSVSWVRLPPSEGFRLRLQGNGGSAQSVVDVRITVGIF